MKILIVTEGFFPGKKYGGPPVSVNNFCSLMDNYDCYIITHNHDLGEKKQYDNIVSGWNDRGNSKVLYLGDNEYISSRFEEIICEVKPDIIYLQSLFQTCVLPCLTLAKKYGTKVLLAPRGELCAGAFRKKYKKLPYIYLLKVLRCLRSVFYQSTSDEETKAIKKYLGADEKRIFGLTNIPSVPQPRSESFEYVQKKAGEARLVFLSRIHPKKNLIQAIKCLKNINGNIIFDIYGSLEDEGYWKICQKEISNLPENIIVNYCGLVSHAEVHGIFSTYDAFLFPTFSENYGHVIIEALTAGCPVIISDRTPWNDLEESKAGFVCTLENPDSFGRAVQIITDSDTDAYRKNAELYAKKKMRLDCLKQEYQKAFNDIVLF